jgi:hypothetical protein
MTIGLNSDQRLFENFERLIVRRNRGSKGRFLYWPKTPVLRLLGPFEVVMAIDCE